jgi:hypothetical protein
MIDSFTICAFLWIYFLYGLSTDEYNEFEPKLFGIFATHSPELCPMNNQTSKKIFMQMKVKWTKLWEILDRGYSWFYLSVLKHQLIIIIRATNTHKIESMCIEVLDFFL